jgi:hypothetical protein
MHFRKIFKDAHPQKHQPVQISEHNLYLVPRLLETLVDPDTPMRLSAHRLV